MSVPTDRDRLRDILLALMPPSGHTSALEVVFEGAVPACRFWQIDQQGRTRHEAPGAAVAAQALSLCAAWIALADPSGSARRQVTVSVTHLGDLDVRFGFHGPAEQRDFIPVSRRMYLPRGGEASRWIAAERRMDVDETLRAAERELAAKNALHAGAWGFAGDTRYRVALATREIWFQTPAGHARAPMQVVGTYHKRDRSFWWSWDHDRVPAALCAHARLVRAWGLAQGLPLWTTGRVHCEAVDAWTFTAMAVHLGGAAGGFHADEGVSTVYLTFGPPTHHDEPLGE